jgi:nucleotide-binding universal stress UspA family protein
MTNTKGIEISAVNCRMSTSIPANDGANGPRVPAFFGCGSWGERLPIRPRRIIVGTDFSPAAESAGRLAVGIALASDALVDLVHVFDAFTETFIHKDGDVLGKSDGILTEIDQALAHRERMTTAQGVRCVHTTLVGSPGIVLGRHAASTATDLIILGGGAQEPGRFGWTWGRRAADQILRSSRWRGIILVRHAV